MKVKLKIISGIMRELRLNSSRRQISKSGSTLPLPNATSVRMEKTSDEFSEWMEVYFPNRKKKA